MCSFPACRDRGVKFLFCAYCHGPVAKRNFRSRHSHKEQQEEQSNTSAKAAAANGSRPFHRQTLPKTYDNENRKQTEASVKNRISSSSSHQTSESASPSGSSANAPHELNNGKRNRDDSHSSTEKSSGSDDPPTSNAGSEDSREAIWASLLKKRPRTDTGDEMSAWLMKVMAVSDDQKSLSEVSSYINDSGPNPKFKMVGQSTHQGSYKSSLLESSDTNDSCKSTSVEGDTNDSRGEMNGSSDSALPAESLSSSMTTTGGSSNDSSSDTLSDHRDGAKTGPPSGSSSSEIQTGSSCIDSSSDTSSEHRE